ncbi:MAG: hypothetical protein AAGO57_09260 [Pseudomonadota bacterium]
MAFRALLAVSALSFAAPVLAGDIERACLGAERSSASRTLCGCIQDAADLTLSTQDQRRAAAFFRDPHQAQVVRQSDRRSDERFWDRYKQFGETAESFCQR